MAFLSRKKERRGEGGAPEKGVDLRKLSRLDLVELLMADMDTIDELRARVARLEEKLAASTETVGRLTQKLDDKDAQIEHLKHRLDAKDDRIRDLEGAVSGRDGSPEEDGGARRESS